MRTLCSESPRAPSVLAMLLQLVFIKGFSSACQCVICPHDSRWGLVPFNLIYVSLSSLLFSRGSGKLPGPNELSHAGITTNQTFLCVEKTS